MAAVVASAEVDGEEAGEGGGRGALEVVECAEGGRLEEGEVAGDGGLDEGGPGEGGEDGGSGEAWPEGEEAGGTEDSGRWLSLSVRELW